MADHGFGHEQFPPFFEAGTVQTPTYFSLSLRVALPFSLALSPFAPCSPHCLHPRRVVGSRRSKEATPER